MIMDFYFAFILYSPEFVTFQTKPPLNMLYIIYDIQYIKGQRHSATHERLIKTIFKSRPVGHKLTKASYILIRSFFLAVQDSSIGDLVTESDF